MAITSPTYDPVTTATALAEKYVAGQQQMLKSRTTQANATEKALGELSSALSTFQSALASMAAPNKTLFAQSAVFGDGTIGSATATAKAAPGTYSFFVESLAAAGQVSYSGLTEDMGASGILKVNVGGAMINIDLTAANTGGASTPLTPREIAAAINADSENNSLVTASVITTATGKYELVLTARQSGANSAVSIDASGLTNSSLTGKTTNTLVKESDAVIRIGSATGPKIEQPTNVFTGIDGVNITFTKTTTAPVTLTVGPDTSATNASVQGFVDAYNKLKGILDQMVAPGDPAKGIAPGAFAGDAGVGALRDRMVGLLRQNGTDSLANYGILANRQGTLSVDTTRLNKALALAPNGLDQLIGKAVTGAPTGIAGAIDTYLKGWTSGFGGQIKTRQEAVSKLQIELTTRQGLIDQQFDAAYNRYLLQFTRLQSIQSQMTNNSSIFDALFGNDKD